MKENTNKIIAYIENYTTGRMELQPATEKGRFKFFDYL